MLNYSINHKVVYKSLNVIGFPKHRVGSDGTVWEMVKGRYVKLTLHEIINIKNRKKPSIYLTVRLKHNGKSEKWCVHRLILTTFIGPCPEGKECCHWDGNSCNNRLDNLRWDTRKNNHQDRIRHGTNNGGENNGACVTTEKTVKKIRSMYATGKYQQKELASIFNLTKANVWCIVNRISWKHI